MNDRIRLNRTYPYLLMVALLLDVLHENFGGTRVAHPPEGRGNTAFQPEGVVRYSEG